MFSIKNTTTNLSRLELARLANPGGNDRALVRSIAARLVDDLGISGPPVDLEMVASLPSIHQVVTDDALPVAGCLLRRDGRFEIRVRGSDPVGRQRFTVGHECAHTFFPGYATRPQFRCVPNGPFSDRRERQVEALCDVGASELLLPTRLVSQDLPGTPFGMAGLVDLADRYQAGLEATGHRLVTEWQRPAALLVLSVRRKPRDRADAEPRLRLDYAHHHGAWPYFLRHKSVTPGDVVERALHGEVVSESATLSGICSEPVRADVHARVFPITVDGILRERVLVLLRRPRPAP